MLSVGTLNWPRSCEAIPPKKMESPNVIRWFTWAIEKARKLKPHDLTIISSLAACVATGFSGWAAWETRSTVTEMTNGTKASTWVALLPQYSTNEMEHSMELLSDFQRAHKANTETDAATTLQKADQSQDNEGWKLHAARRRVIDFFENVYMLEKLHVIDVHDVAWGFDESTYCFVEQVIIPLQNANYANMIGRDRLTTAQKEEAQTDDQDMLNFFWDVAKEHHAIRKKRSPARNSACPSSSLASESKSEPATYEAGPYSNAW